MTSARVYLDWNATAPLLDGVRAAMIDALDVYGNASSVHAEGRRARALVETAREAVAALSGARAADVIFTSGATEANATVMAGGWDTIVLSGIEHDSVLGPAERSGARLIKVPVSPDGVVEVGVIADAILARAATGRTLISLQAANNETGVIQPVAEVAAFARAHAVAMHVDAVQAAGRLALPALVREADFVSLSAHKIGGPKGIGALIARDGAVVRSLVPGGGQERRRRGGTENTTAIAGFGAAASAAVSVDVDVIRARRDALEVALLGISPRAEIIGRNVARLANTTCVTLPGHSAETLLIKLDLAGFAISAGAACSSGKVGNSHVLEAMGLASDRSRGAVRISIGPATTDAEIRAFLDAWTTLVRPAALAA